MLPVIGGSTLGIVTSPLWLSILFVGIGLVTTIILVIRQEGKRIKLIASLEKKIEKNRWRTSPPIAPSVEELARAARDVTTDEEAPVPKPSLHGIESPTYADAPQEQIEAQSYDRQMLDAALKRETQARQAIQKVQEGSVHMQQQVKDRDTVIARVTTELATEKRDRKEERAELKAKVQERDTEIAKLSKELEGEKKAHKARYRSDGRTYARAVGCRPSGTACLAALTIIPLGVIVFIVLGSSHSR